MLVVAYATTNGCAGTRTGTVCREPGNPGPKQIREGESVKLSKFREDTNAMARSINLGATVTGLVMVFVLILVFAAFSGPISGAINDTYVGTGAASTLWTTLVFLLIVLSIILTIVFWALSHVSGKRG